MNKEEITQLALNLYEETALANQYWAIIKQYDEMIREYYDEMNYSPAFFYVTHNALVEALIMKLARLYEKGKNASGIYSLFLACKENIEIFPEYREKWSSEYEGEVYTNTIPFEMYIASDEEAFFPDKVKEYHTYQKLFDILIPDGHKSSGTKMRLEFSREELFELFQKKYSRLNKTCKNLRKQRNSIYAHIDPAVNFDYKKIYKEYPINREDIERLISFSLDFSQLCVELLTGVVKPDLHINIDDLRNILHYAKIGNLYAEQYWKDKEKEIQEQVLSETNCDDEKY